MLLYSRPYMVTQDAVLDALRAVKDPEAQQDIVALGLIRDLAIAESQVSFKPGVHESIRGVEGHHAQHGLTGRRPRARRGQVQVKMGSGQPARPAQAGGSARARPPPGQPRRGLDPRGETDDRGVVGQGGRRQVHGHVISRWAAPGGQRRRHQLIPTSRPDIPLMLGPAGGRGCSRTGSSRSRPRHEDDSIGLLVNEKEPLVWRGPMIHSFIQADAEGRQLGRGSTISSSTCRGDRRRPAVASPVIPLSAW